MVRPRINGAWSCLTVERAKSTKVGDGDRWLDDNTHTAVGIVAALSRDRRTCFILWTLAHGSDLGWALTNALVLT